MAITIVQSSFTPNHFASGASLTATGSLTNPVGVGNAVLIGFGGNDSFNAKTIGSVTDNKSNSYSTLTYDNATTAGQGWFLATNITNGPNSSVSVPFTQTSTQANVMIAVYEISGLGLTPADVAAFISRPFATTATASFTTTAINEMGFALISGGGNNTTMAQTNGWTQDSTNFGGSPAYYAAFAHNALPTSGANSEQTSASVGDLWYFSIVTLKPGAAPPPPTQYFLESTEYF